MIPQEIVAKKRDGGRLSREEIERFVEGLSDGRVGEGQAAAFAMAVFFRGLDDDECAALARAMARSGRVLDWRAHSLPGPVVDKHSTGGVGDLPSLVLAPMAAACGLFVPMVAGRGLGHTGGTVDKLESIPGYRVRPTEAEFRRALREAGCAIIGQTDELAPADRRLYAIRDVTATVESIPLIVASILSKKLAAGVQGLVMDVKAGGGAFMPTRSLARELARRIARVARDAGLPTACLVTDMSEPLAPVAGNALEVRYAVDLLKGTRRDARVEELCVALVAEMLLLGGLVERQPDARRRAQDALRSGAAAERFATMTRALGGPANILERAHALLPAASVTLDVEAEFEGHLQEIDARALGVTVLALGGGRTRPHDAIDHSVGLDGLARKGDKIEKGAPLARVHARSRDEAERARDAVRAAMRIGEAPPKRQSIVIERLREE